MSDQSNPWDVAKASVAPGGSQEARLGPSLPGGKDQGTLWEKIGQGGYSAVNEILMGLPDFLVKKIAGSETYKKFEDARAANPRSAKIGEAAGLVASMALPVGEGVGRLGAKMVETGIPIVKGVGEGIRAAGQAAGGLRAMGTGVLPSAARNLALAGAQAIPRAVGQGLNTGDWGQAAKNAALNTGIGGALGTGVEQATKAIGPALTKMQLRARGIDTSALRKGAAESARFRGQTLTSFQAKHGQETAEKVLQLMKEEGGFGRVGQQKAVKYIEDSYNSYAQAYKAAGVQVADRLDQITNSDAIQKLRSAYPGQGKVIDDAILNTIQSVDDITKTYGWTKGRVFLNDQTKMARNMVDSNDQRKMAMGSIINDVSHIVKDQMTDITRAFKTPEMPDLDLVDAAYGASRVVRNALAKGEGIVPSIEANSKTGITQKIMANLGLGNVAGGIVASQMKSDPDDPLGGLKWGARIIGGSILGGIANKAGAVIGNQIMGRGAAALQGAGGVAPGILSRLAGTGAGTNVAQGKTISGAMPPGAAPAPVAPTPSMQAGPAKAPTLNAPVGNAAQLLSARLAAAKPAVPAIPIALKAPAQPQVQAAQTKEAEAKPAEVEQAKEAVNTKWADHIEGIIKDYWTRTIAPYGQESYEHFRDQIKDRTNNYDPKNMANVLFKDPKARAQYLRDYNIALRLKGMNLEEAISYPTGEGSGIAQSIQELFRNKAAMAKKKTWDDLHDVFESIGVEEGKPVNAQVKAQIEQQINGIRIQKDITPQAKAQQILDLLQNAYGVNLSQLTAMGATPWLAGGKA